jgi:hypothetical protein
MAAAMAEVASGNRQAGADVIVRGMGAKLCTSSPSDRRHPSSSSTPSPLTAQFSEPPHDGRSQLPPVVHHYFDPPLETTIRRGILLLQLKWEAMDTHDR